jgi:hypothetical protein
MPNYASTEIDADTPEQALTLARAMNESDEIEHFRHYDEAPAVNQIEILDADRNELAHWRDADLILRIVAPDLRDILKEQTDAAQAVIDNWSSGDLAAAVNALESLIEPARTVIGHRSRGRTVSHGPRPTSSKSTASARNPALSLL